MGIYKFHIQHFRALSKADNFFSLGNVDNLPSKYLATNALHTKHIGK